MHAISHRPRRFFGFFGAALLSLILPLTLTMVFGGCKRKVTQAQCDEVLDHFAELVVKERFPDAGAEEIAKERSRERVEAKSADELRNCTSEVQESERACAMKAQTSDALIKCLE